MKAFENLKIIVVGWVQASKREGRKVESRSLISIEINIILLRGPCPTPSHEHWEGT